MNTKKTIAGLSALSVLISSGAFTAMTAFAAETTDYTTGKITAHLYSDEVLRDIECRYYSDMPNVPYIKLSDYYSCWMSQHPDQELEITNNNDGTYNVKVPYGTVGTIDTNKETIETDDIAYFMAPEYAVSDDSEELYTYIRQLNAEPLSGEEDEDEDDESASLDLSEYKIDLRGDESDIWWPVQTLCDFYDYGLNQGSIIDDELYFCGSIMSKYSKSTVTLNYDHIANYTERYKNGRPKDLAEYNYNELCFAFDKNYGYPGRFIYNDLLEEKGFDEMLSTASEGTKMVKELLLSEDVYEYYAGYYMLNNYLWDGGHTFFSNAFLQPNTEFTAKVFEKLSEIGLPEDAGNWAMENAIDNMSAELADEARKEMLKTADKAEKLTASTYSVKGDTAVFSFDLFDDEDNKWKSYYNNGGEMPQDIISEFYSCIEKADSDPAIKNFVIDLGTNTGGLLTVTEYMMSLISDLDNVTLYYGPGSPAYKVHYSSDKNLDKAFDDKDKNFKTDLNFGIITSQRSFSCGNLMPSLAKDKGIMLVGEKSGGGTCSVTYCTTADGLFYSVSSGIKFSDKDGNTIDNGIVPDYNLVKMNDDGTKDYSEVYNYSRLSELFAEFYGKKNEDDTTVTTTTAASASTTTTTTTTVTAASSVSSSSVTSTEASAASTSTTTSAETAQGSTTTSSNISELPQTGNNSAGTAAAAACAAVMAAAGGAAVFMSRRKED